MTEADELLQKIAAAADSLDRLTEIAVAAGEWHQARQACIGAKQIPQGAYGCLALAEAALAAAVAK